MAMGASCDSRGFERHGTSYSLGSTWCGNRQLASGILMLVGTNAAPVAKQGEFLTLLVRQWMLAHKGEENNDSVI